MQKKEHVKIIKKEENITNDIPSQNIIKFGKSIKSICKINYKNNNKECNGTGFFILLKNSLKCLMTNYHIISKNLIEQFINIEIYNNKNTNIKLYDRYMKFYDNLDITIIEIKESDKIIKDIDFLDYDLNNSKGYEQYLNQDIFILNYQKGEKICYSRCKIIDIFNKYEFKCKIANGNDSSGAPIILFNTLKVIGIHKGGDIKNNINYGTFIGEIFNENKVINNIIKKEIIKNNYILAEIYISKENVGKEIRIINS